MPELGDTRTDHNGPDISVQVYDGEDWVGFDTAQEALEYRDRLLAARDDGLEIAEPEPVRRGPPSVPFGPHWGGLNANGRVYTEEAMAMAFSGIDRPVVQRELQRIRTMDGREEIIPGRIQPLTFVNGARVDGSYEPPANAPIGSYYYNTENNTINVRTPEGWREEALSTYPMGYMNLQTAQGEDLDRLATTLGLQRDRSWPHGIGRAIEPDRDFRERMLTVIQAHLPRGVTPMHMELSQDGTYVNVSASVQLNQPLEYVKIDLSVKEERHDIIDEESRWDQISEELFSTKTSGSNTEEK